MSTNDNNGAAPAFPVPRDPMRLRCDGLTKREYTVIELAKGFLSNPNYEWADHVDVVRADALRQADAILEALSEPPASPSPTEGEARKVLDALEKTIHTGGGYCPECDRWDVFELKDHDATCWIARALLSQFKGGGSDD